MERENRKGSSSTAKRPMWDLGPTCSLGTGLRWLLPWEFQGCFSWRLWWYVLPWGRVVLTNMVPDPSSFSFLARLSLSSKLVPGLAGTCEAIGVHLSNGPSWWSLVKGQSPRVALADPGGRAGDTLCFEAPAGDRLRSVTEGQWPPFLPQPQSRRHSPIQKAERWLWPPDLASASPSAQEHIVRRWRQVLKHTSASFVLPGELRWSLRRVWAQGGEVGMGMAPAFLIKGSCWVCSYSWGLKFAFMHLWVFW